MRAGQSAVVELALPPGAPGRPLLDAELAAKVAGCAGAAAGAVLALDWGGGAAALLGERLS